MTPTYCIIRRYRDGHDPKYLADGLTLEEAQAWCRDPETSSRTATTAEAMKETATYGPWFDGYEEE